MPAAPGPPVRTASVIQSARMPEVMKVFSPSITQASPSRRAVVRRRATSEPPPGSVMASAAIFSPARTSGTMRRCSAGLPCATTGGSRCCARTGWPSGRRAGARDLLGGDQPVPGHRQGVPPSDSG
jgi:hypothetical protein